MQYSAVLCLIIGIAISCGVKNPTRTDSPHMDSHFSQNLHLTTPDQVLPTLRFSSLRAKREWLEKASRKLGIVNLSSIEELESLPSDKILNSLMAKKEFRDKMFEFFTYYFGFSAPTDISVVISALPNIYHAAQAMFLKKEKLQLWETLKELPLLVPPLIKVSHYSQLVRERLGITDEMTQKELSQRLRQGFIEDRVALITEIKQSDLTRESICSIIKTYAVSENRISMDALGLPPNLVSLFNQGLTASIGCLLDNVQYPVNIDSVIIDIEREMAFLKSIELALESVVSYSMTDINKLDSIKTLNISQLDLPENKLFNGAFWLSMSNHSTNQNRKRAAYILKRFFCDDLTPVNVTIPEMHAAFEDNHAGKATCFSCHYKLDPMAGFFRHIGMQGYQFKGSHIVFDDFVASPLEPYAAKWHVYESNGVMQANDIGFIRSLSDPGSNDYGQSMSDLYRIINESMEAKQCFVKKLAAYFIDENQAFDPDYIAELATSLFKSKHETNAITYVIGQLLSSNVFQTRDPNNQKCYDFLPRYYVSERPPCQVATYLERNCIACHNQQINNGGLDLTRWIQQDDGKFGFMHTRDGKKISSRQSLSLILERLVTPDDALRMPLGKDMSSKDREKIYSFLKNKLLEHMEMP